ncbi:MAG: precorrin-4 C(11)-methyltransferase [Thaumarchaeota archaeon]|nr:precorrin-4 C(11)-methyltransferase [Nitrososphaerota archaeon]RNJ71637.1 MAG: precorrin-4 C(11)-methyltransferase [Thaumarchaeota archaeon S13]RNJ71996.1 MAG: precorrin-4 C(11)-methyltransferase [Thaumarchaeota archaeon S14]RNJ73511.1 MAG: precorrin-4 C(11)-methyltransferase [Thaumarchaeota archaeon S15]MDD9808904.1 precorrin-4 C(11)-methyltransferase [Nitrososphaerota archaeon]
MVDFVGCGPGAPDLITVRAREALERAEVVVYSGSLVPEGILAMCGGARMHDASGMVREEITRILADGARAGLRTVRLHDGDPSIYGAVREQVDALAAEGIESRIVPGVTSFLAAAAALGTQLTLPGVTQTIILTRVERRTEVPERERVRSLASHGATMVFYLSVHLLETIVAESLAGGYAPTTPAAVVYRASWDDERVVKGTLEDIARLAREAGITRTAIVIVGDAVAPSSYEFSRLYDASFGHGYRRART